jgi:hypothetical protein
MRSLLKLFRSRSANEILHTVFPELRVPEMDAICGLVCFGTKASVCKPSYAVAACREVYSLFVSTHIDLWSVGTQCIPCTSVNFGSLIASFTVDGEESGVAAC